MYLVNGAQMIKSLMESRTLSEEQLNQQLNNRMYMCLNNQSQTASITVRAPSMSQKELFQHH